MSLTYFVVFASKALEVLLAQVPYSKGITDGSLPADLRRLVARLRLQTDLD